MPITQIAIISQHYNKAHQPSTFIILIYVNSVQGMSTVGLEMPAAANIQAPVYILNGNKFVLTL